MNTSFMYPLVQNDIVHIAFFLFISGNTTCNVNVRGITKVIVIIHCAFLIQYLPSFGEVEFAGLLIFIDA